MVEEAVTGAHHLDHHVMVKQGVHVLRHLLPELHHRLPHLKHRVSDAEVGVGVIGRVGDETL